MIGLSAARACQYPDGGTHVLGWAPLANLESTVLSTILDVLVETTGPAIFSHIRTSNSSCRCLPQVAACGVHRSLTQVPAEESAELIWHATSGSSAAECMWRRDLTPQYVGGSTEQHLAGQYALDYGDQFMPDWHATVSALAQRLGTDCPDPSSQEWRRLSGPRTRRPFSSYAAEQWLWG